MTAVVKAANATLFNTPWEIAPSRFCSGVWVGWSNSNAFVTKINAVEFNSYLVSRFPASYRFYRMKGEKDPIGTKNNVIPYCEGYSPYSKLS